MGERGDWVAYYDEQGEREPRELLVDALDRFDREERVGAAVDLGCGQGIDTMEMLRRGWTVLAVDAEPDGIRRLRARAGEAPRLTTIVSPMQEVELPEVDLVHASFSLPFCPPAAFPALWERIRGSLRPGGRFAGQLFGERDGWATTEPDMTFFDEPSALSLFEGLDVEVFAEHEEDDKDAWGQPKHWHEFHVIARRPG
jgi:SAM-dependent methyltransferase